MAPAAAELLAVTNLCVDVRAEAGWLRIVDRLSLRLERGRVLGIVGESGCGKTMTALALSRLLAPRTSRIQADGILFNNEDLQAATESRLAEVRGQGIAYVFQEPATSLNPVLTVEEQLAEVLRVHRRDVPASAARLAMTQQLESVGIRNAGQKLRVYPHQLSGGEKQRVMIAMALLARPQILIADEPTTALDVTVQAQLLALLRQLTQAYDVSLIIISHDLSVVAELADEIAVMYAGQIVERGRARRVIDAPQHPYTRGLIASLPELAAEAGRVKALAGEVPQPGSWPAGCRFHPRCPVVFDRCRREMPPLFEVSPGEEVRCWLYSASET